MTDHDGQESAERWVRAFARAWKAPADGDDLVRQFEPWLWPDYRFRQPLTRGVGVGVDQFRRRFARPLFGALSDVHGTVESWAARDDTLFIETVLEPRAGRRRVHLRACDRVRLVNGLATDRHTYFDPLPLLGAATHTPRLWWPLLRRQIAETLERNQT